MEITRSGLQPSSKGPAEWFTGDVIIDPLFQAPQPSKRYGRQRHVRARCSHGLAYSSTRPNVNRNLWPGTGQCWEGPIEEIRPGDFVWFPPGEKHWHGATPSTTMTHIAIQEALDGIVVDWMEHVSDEQYGVLLRRR